MNFSFSDAIGAMVAVATFCAALTSAEPAEAMSELRWKSRPVLIFAPTQSDPRLTTQRSNLAAARAGLFSRDVVAMTIVGNTVKSLVGNRSRLSAASLRKRYGVSGDAFRAVLVGKDGGTKISSRIPLSASQIFATIDAMPMRRQEIRDRR